MNIKDIKRIKTTDLTQDYLKSILNYDPDTGVFTWKVKKAHRIRIGDVAEYITDRGYARITIDGRPFYSHKLAFMYMTGSFPANDIDHINRNKIDNRWCNLRECTRQQNSQNTGLNKNNTSGYKGVGLSSCKKHWRARIRANGKPIEKGGFNTKEEAAIAYNEMAKRYHGEFAYQNVITNTPHTGE